MDDLIKNIKKKLSVDNLVEMMKDAKVIDESRIKEADVRKTLEKVDPNNIIDVDELAMKLTEISEQSKVNAEEAKSQSSKMIEKAKSTFGVFTKAPEKGKEKESDDYFTDNVTGFLD